MAEKIKHKWNVINRWDSVCKVCGISRTSSSQWLHGKQLHVVTYKTLDGEIVTSSPSCHEPKKPVKQLKLEL